MKVPSLRPASPKKGKPSKAAAAVPAPSPPTGDDLEANLTRLRDNLPVSTGWILLVLIVGVASYVGFILQDNDNVSGAVVADVLIGLIGLWILWYIGLVAWITDRIPYEPLQNLPEPLGLREVHISGADAVAEYRRRATAQINGLIERMIYDYGLMLIGQEPPLDYMTAHARTTLVQAVAPVLRAGDQVRPDFGNHVDVSVDWHTGQIGQPVTATAYFIDKSTRISASGLGAKMPERKMRIIAAFDHQFTSVIEATLEPA